jgi:hypothetical protein
MVIELSPAPKNAAVPPPHPRMRPVRIRERAAMSNRPPPVKTATEARQGRTIGVVRWVLGVFLTRTIIAMIAAFLARSPRRVIFGQIFERRMNVPIQTAAV